VTRSAIFCLLSLSITQQASQLHFLQELKVIRTEFQGEAYKAFKVLGLRPPEKFQVLAETAREKATEAKPELT
jgi:hypothetical protein